ncbi:helix-turn-helix domain-containing protein [Pectinatus frisingensis]|uniref:helix-turn-helix domain-containing protein n=1 Tax=Pectinatus frisingensis TaxID=865 RepID=UPI0018C549ED|nr:helix-turn-helix transcriptional regulator [Pectinatus frisingensis]
MDVNTKLKKYIEEKGVSQTSISAKTGIKVKTLNAILNRHAALKVTSLIDICEKGLDTKPENFFMHKFQ